jgi:signal transduction histidine kinase/HAMP domain-containing protein
MKIKSLKFKINAAIFLTYIIVAIFFGAIFLKSESNNRINRIEGIKLLLNSVFQQNRKNLANEIFGRYNEALIRSIDGIKDIKGIIEIYVYDKKGNPLYFDEKTKIDTLSIKEQKDLIKNPSFTEIKKDGIPFAIYITGIKVMEECYGYLKIYYDLTELKKESFFNIKIFIAQLSVTFLILFGILNLLLFKSVIQPASILRDAIKKVRQGNLGENVNIKSQDEIGEIAGDFNNMSSMLQKQHTELLESREMLQLVIDNIPQMIFWKNNKSVFLGCNKNFAKKIGAEEPENVINKTDYELPWDKEILSSFQNISKEAMFFDKPRLHVEKKFTLNKIDSYLDANFIPLHNTKGGVVGILCTYENITEKIKAKEEREKLEIQLLHTSRLTAMGEMAAGIAHELNQPLSIINVSATGLIDHFSKKEPEKKSDNIIYHSSQKIAYQVSRASNIIDNMRSFVRISSQPTKPIDIKKPINLALSFFKEQFRIHGIMFKVNLDDNVPLVIADSQKFEQIVVNLLTNARYAVDEKAKTADSEYKKEVSVNLSYDKSSNLVIFEIIDNGIGMTFDESSRCMEPFYTTKEVGEGTGLGLSIVYNIVRELKMNIDIQSVKDAGSTFCILIPIKGKKWNQN